ncbi:uncharacterized protein LOC143298750 isoform X2 [Babylonia areolata]
MCACPGCHKSSVISIDELDVCIDDFEQSCSVTEPVGLEGSRSDLLCTCSSGHKSGTSGKLESRQMYSSKQNRNSNADTENVSSDNRNNAGQSTSGTDAHDEADHYHSIVQPSGIGSDSSPVEQHTQTDIYHEENTEFGTSTSDLHGLAQSLRICSEGLSSADVDSLPTSELASFQSGLSLEPVSSTEYLDSVPLLSAVRMDQNQFELSEASCFSREIDSLPLVSAIHLDQTYTVNEQSSFGRLSPLMSVDVSEVPDELLLKIFSYLKPAELCSHVTAVCKYWRRLAYDHSLWRKLDVSNIRMRGLQLCQVVLRVSGAIHYLDMSGVERLTNAEMAVVAENCPLLTHLDLGFVDDLNCTMMHAILTSCPCLEFLNVEGCRHVNNEMMRVLVASAGSQLKQLNFSHCSLVDESLWLMMRNIRGLTHLNIDGISWISELVVRHLALEYSGTMESWELDGNELTDGTILSVSACHCLKILSVSFCEQLTDQSIKHLQRLENLEKLSLRKGPAFSASALTELLSSPTLRSLTYLDLTECQQLEDQGVQAIAHTCSQKLKTLCLSWCWDVTDKGMEHIASRCSQLVNMYLVGLHRLEGLWLPMALDNMANLVYISFEQCNEVVDSVIEEAVRDKPDLAILNYYGELFMQKAIPSRLIV